MLCAHGGAWLMLRTDEALKQRSAKATQIMAIIFLICFLVIEHGCILGKFQVIAMLLL